MKILITEKQLENCIRYINEQNEFFTKNDIKKAFYAGRKRTYDPSDCYPEFDYLDFEDWFNDKQQLEEQKNNTNNKQNLYMIATLAYKLWEQMKDDEQLDEWMSSKITQAEQNIVAVAKSYQYGETPKGIDKLDFDDLVIGG